MRAGAVGFSLQINQSFQSIGIHHLVVVVKIQAMAPVIATDATRLAKAPKNALPICIFLFCQVILLV
tara:strand:+ start:156 stop:356 length:201 start_codon:yes stop_codon:yes gene_type:complete